MTNTTQTINRNDANAEQRVSSNDNRQEAQRGYGQQTDMRADSIDNRSASVNRDANDHSKTLRDASGTRESNVRNEYNQNDISTVSSNATSTPNHAPLNKDQRDNVISGLKDLINYTIDSIEGYRKAADMVRDNEAELADYFESCASKRDEKRTELFNILSQYESNQEDSFNGTNSGTLHQAFTSFRSVFQSDRKAALNEVERGEDYLADQYEEFLDQKNLPETLIATLRRHHQEIERREDMAEDLLEAS